MVRAKTNDGDVTILIGSRKGAFFLTANRSRSRWRLSDPLYLGHIIYHAVADPRDGRILLMAAKTGHLGPTVFRSTDSGLTWKEAQKLPAFPKAPEGAEGRAVDNVFWLSPGHPSEPGVWYAGTSPPGLFRSEDNGDTWEPVSGFNDHPMYGEWTKQGGTPGGHLLHSILIDPRNPSHIYLGISVGGVFESTDKGKNWHPLNAGCAADFLPDGGVTFGHDPHCVILHPLAPDRLYQQNHCGIYRLDRPGQEWTRIGNNMPREVGDIGFPIITHPKNPDHIWVFPMDGTEVWPRTSPDGKPATYVSEDGGASWRRQDRGLPRRHAYFTVKRQAMTVDGLDPVGVYFGTTGGEVWGSSDQGESWGCLARHLPEVYSLTMAVGSR